MSNLFSRPSSANIMFQSRPLQGVMMVWSVWPFRLWALFFWAAGVIIIILFSVTLLQTQLSAHMSAGTLNLFYHLFFFSFFFPSCPMMMTANLFYVTASWMVLEEFLEGRSEFSVCGFLATSSEWNKELDCSLIISHFISTYPLVSKRLRCTHTGDVGNRLFAPAIFPTRLTPG